MEKEPTSEGSSRGATLIAPKVLITTARLTALGVPGVVGLAPIPGGVNRLFRRGDGEGVRIEVDGQAVSVDLHLIVRQGTNGAVELARVSGPDSAPRFVNGVLGSLAEREDEIRRQLAPAR